MEVIIRKLNSDTHNIHKTDKCQGWDKFQAKMKSNVPSSEFIRGKKTVTNRFLWILSMINDEWSFCLLIAHWFLWFGRFYTLAYVLYRIFQILNTDVNHYVFVNFFFWVESFPKLDTMKNESKQSQVQSVKTAELDQLNLRNFQLFFEYLKRKCE